MQWVYSILFALVCGALGFDKSLKTRQIAAYAPYSSSCPKTPLVRAVNQKLSDAELRYISARKKVTNEALTKWLSKISPEFDTLRLPSIGITSSGGGWRTVVETAGVIHAFDSRDGNYSVSGIYQAATYIAGLSGGSWILAGLAANSWPTITSWKKSLLDKTLANTPGQDARDGLLKALIAKSSAGFVPTLTDAFGLIQGYRLFPGDDGGAAITLSGLASSPEFKSHNVPYPIIVATGLGAGECYPNLDNPLYEFHPYEYGSWDQGVQAFSQTQYMGTKFTSGVPQSDGCIQGFDNIFYVMSASSNTFTWTCQNLPSTNSTDVIMGSLEEILQTLHPAEFRDELAVIPNPFHHSVHSPLVENQAELSFVDGGATLQNNPIWPFIQPARKSVIDFLIVIDNSADDDMNWPNGTAIHTTYMRANKNGMTRMPKIPPVNTFTSEGLNKRATFFGCNDPNALTILYLPNTMYSYASNQPSPRPIYSPEELADMIENGVQIGTQNGDAGWPMCLACGFMKKLITQMPKKCEACFKKYCYN
jgi:lysophospholipase